MRNTLKKAIELEPSLKIEDIKNRFFPGNGVGIPTTKQISSKINNDDELRELRKERQSQFQEFEKNERENEKRKAGSGMSDEREKKRRRTSIGGFMDENKLAMIQDEHESAVDGQYIITEVEASDDTNFEGYVVAIPLIESCTYSLGQDLKTNTLYLTSTFQVKEDDLKGYDVPFDVKYEPNKVLTTLTSKKIYRIKLPKDCYIMSMEQFRIERILFFTFQKVTERYRKIVIAPKVVKREPQAINDHDE